MMQSRLRAEALIEDIRRILEKGLSDYNLKFEITNHLVMDEFKYGPMVEWAEMVKRTIYRNRLETITSNMVRNKILRDCVDYNAMSIQESHAICEYLMETGHLKQVEDVDEHGFNRRYITTLHRQF